MAFNQHSINVRGKLTCMMTQYLQRILQLLVQSLPGFRAACESNFSKVREKWPPFTKKYMNDKAIL